MAFTKTLAAAAFIYSTLTSALPRPQATYGSTSPSQQFNLQPVVTAGNASIFPSRLYISTQHTGAGTSAAVAVTNQTLAGVFNINNTYLGVDGGSPEVPYTVGLFPESAFMSNAPASYGLVDVDAGLYTPGFSLDPGNFVQYGGNVSFTTFALCSVNGTAPYFSLGPDYQLFYKNQTSVPSAPNCADVKLSASYVTPTNTPQ